MKENVDNVIVTIIKGMIVGTGAILPGVSGGVLCMAFGIYEPLMDVLSDPLHRYKKHLKLLVPFLIGWLAGFLLLAKLLEILLLRYETAVIVFFAGAIIGTIPGLMKDMDKDLKTFLPVLLWTIFFLLVFRFMDTVQTNEIEPNFFWYVFSGAVWGLSMIVPGLSSSSLLIMMGLYQKITAGIASIDLSVILPLLLGLLLTVLSLSKLMHHLFETRRRGMLLFVSGIMIASSIDILMKTQGLTLHVPLYILLFVIGYITAVKLDG